MAVARKAGSWMSYAVSGCGRFTIGCVVLVVWVLATQAAVNAEIPGWETLRWGMTDEEARQGAGVAGELHATPRGLKYQMNLPASVIGVPCTAVLLFDADRRLEKLVLWVHDPNIVIYGDLARFIERELGTFTVHQQLTERSSGSTVERTLWQLPSTRVSLVWSVYSDKEKISITYEPADALRRP